MSVIGLTSLSHLGEMDHSFLLIVLLRTELSLMVYFEPKHSCYLKPEHFSGLLFYFFSKGRIKHEKKIPVHRPKLALFSLCSTHNIRHTQINVKKISSLLGHLKINGIV